MADVNGLQCSTIVVVIVVVVVVVVVNVVNVVNDVVVVVMRSYIINEFIHK